MMYQRAKENTRARLRMEEEARSLKEQESFQAANQMDADAAREQAVREDAARAREHVASGNGASQHRP